MRTPRPLTVLLFLQLCGCSSTFGNGQDDSGTSDGDGGSEPGGNGLPDLEATLVTGDCEEVPTGEGDTHPGADSYFVGTYEADGSSWSGTEVWLLYANQAWIDVGGADCVITWTTQASEGSPTVCGTCDIGLSVTATLDEGSTTCDEGLWQDDLNWSVDYDVALGDDGASTWYFGSSGTEFGAGYADSNSLNFATPHSCSWF